jgi:hypothetical protein
MGGAGADAIPAIGVTRTPHVLHPSNGSLRSAASVVRDVLRSCSPPWDVATIVGRAYDVRVKKRGKQRLSASIAATLLGAAEDAVARGDAPSLSAWVSDAIQLKLEHDARLAALAGFIRAYEAEHGEITADEMRLAARRARARAVTVREALPPARRRSRRAGGGAR